MENLPLISVIVPVYKVEKYLERCVRSLQEQTYGHLEIILVDDGSPDGSGALCDALAAADDRIRVIHKENGGLSSARNAGIDIAGGDYLGFVDSDDWIEPETYRTLLETAQKEQVKLVCGGRYDYNPETGEKTVGLCPGKKEVISGLEFARRIFIWDQVDSSACDKLYARELFREIRYPIGVTSEDVPVTYRIALDAERVALVDIPFYNYYHRPESITTSHITEKSFHYLVHSQKICEHIRRDYPQILPEARYFRVCNLAYMLQRMELAGQQVKEKFADRYREIRRELRHNIPFILTNTQSGLKQRVLWLVLALGGYGIVRKIYRLIR